jgi:molecular chaperone HscB
MSFPIVEHACWRCGHDAPQEPDAASLFCQFCNSLQRPVVDYYAFFGFEKSLSLDLDELQRRYYALSRQLHPDRYTRAAETERNYSLEATSILNDGFRTLRDPVRRAEYILKESGLEAPAERSKNVPPELLQEVFELNEALDELRSGDDSALPQLTAARGRFLELQRALDAELDAQFKLHDATPRDQRAAVLGQVRTRLDRRRYLSNLIQEVDKELAARQS